MALISSVKTGGVEAVTWPQLHELRLSQSKMANRRQSIGGSDANIIFSEDHERIRRLWLEKRGEAEAVDLSVNLPVMLGSWTEAFNRQWFEQITGRAVNRVGDTVCSAQHHWRGCTLDGFVEHPAGVWEAKHTNAFASREEVIARYMPQLQHNMAVTRAERAYLSVIFGNHKFEIIEIAADWIYELELLEAEEAFWSCVVSGREPVALAAPQAPLPVGIREISLEGNNAWASAAADWLAHREAAKVHAGASKALKELVADDVARAFGHGVEAKRSKSGAISIRDFS